MVLCDRYVLGLSRGHDTEVGVFMKCVLRILHHRPFGVHAPVAACFTREKGGMHGEVGEAIPERQQH